MRSSMWFFGALAVFAVIAVTTPIVYNLSIQLTPQQLDAARSLWEQNRPDDYDLKYWVLDGVGPVRTEVAVVVRAGRAQSFERNGERVGVEEAGRYGVTALFDLMEENLRKDSGPGAPRVYACAFFDPKDGHPTRYVRRVRQTGERYEVIVRMEAPGAAKP